MKKTLTLLIALIVLTTIIPISSSSEKIDSSNHTIEITTEDNKIKVKETISLTGETGQIINFWIQTGAEEYVINSGEIELTKEPQEPTEGNVYSYMLSSPNITRESLITIVISYTLRENTESFQKRLLYNNSEITVTLDGKRIYKAINLKNNSYFDLTLYEITESPLTWYIIGFVILLIILLGVTGLYSIKKQKPGKKKDTSAGSEELLSTKKGLLMEVLKDIEKQHRAKKISDDTYHKLKDEYKQDAVDTMKKLEESKVK